MSHRDGTPVDADPKPSAARPHFNYDFEYVGSDSSQILAVLKELLRTHKEILRVLTDKHSG